MAIKKLSQSRKSINYLKKSLAIAITVLVLLIAAATFAREEVIDGTLEPDQITDTEAWEQLFLLLSPKGDHRWVNEGFMDNWLAEGGLSQHEAQRVVAAAWRHLGDPEVHQVDNDILETVNKGRNDRKVNELVQFKRAKLYGQVMQLARELDTIDNVLVFLHEQVKKNTVSNKQALLRTLLPVLYAQSMSGSATKTQIISLNGRIMATKAAANTGGTFGHTVRITSRVKSPSGRFVDVTSGTGFSVTATAYIDLCSSTICEDGWYSSSMIGNIFCRYGGNFPQFSQGGPNSQAKKFTTLDSIRFSNPNGTTITSIPRSNGRAYLRAKIRKSVNCTEEDSMVVETVFQPDAGMKFFADPIIKDIPFVGYQGEGIWVLQMRQDNIVGGQMDVGSTMATSPDCPPREIDKKTSISIQ